MSAGDDNLSLVNSSKKVVERSNLSNQLSSNTTTGTTISTSTIGTKGEESTNTTTSTTSISSSSNKTSTSISSSNSSSKSTTTKPKKKNAHSIVSSFFSATSSSLSLSSRRLSSKTKNVTIRRGGGSSSSTAEDFQQSSSPCSRENSASASTNSNNNNNSIQVIADQSSQSSPAAEEVKVSRRDKQQKTKKEKKKSEQIVRHSHRTGSGCRSRDEQQVDDESAAAKAVFDQTSPPQSDSPGDNTDPPGDKRAVLVVDAEELRDGGDVFVSKGAAAVGRKREDNLVEGSPAESESNLAVGDQIRTALVGNCPNGETNRSTFSFSSSSSVVVVAVVPNRSQAESSTITTTTTTTTDLYKDQSIIDKNQNQSINIDKNLNQTSTTKNTTTTTTNKNNRVSSSKRMDIKRRLGLIKENNNMTRMSSSSTNNNNNSNAAQQQTSGGADAEPSASSSTAAEPQDIQWRFSQMKGNLDTEELSEADLISCIEFSHDGELLATGDKGGRVVIFQRDPDNKFVEGQRSTDYNVYSTFQSHEPEFDYLKSLEIEEKINKIRWLKRKNAAHFLLSTNDKTVKLWKISERDKKVGDGNWNLRSVPSMPRNPADLRVPNLVPMELVVEASPRRVYANAHTYHINSISVNSDTETFLSADDLRINLWNLEITNQSFNFVDIKPGNMEELTEVITAAEFHPHHCHQFVYSSSKGTLRLCDMREQALCDQHSKLLEEPEDPASRSFFSEIISSISDVKFSHTGRYLLTRDYLTVKVWDLNMESRPVETYSVHEYLRSKLCSLYENDCIFDKFECSWSGNDEHIITGSYNNFFRTFSRKGGVGSDLTLEASPDIAKPRTVLKPKKVSLGGKRKKEELSADSLDFTRKILHTAWHPQENIVAVAATNNLYIFQDR